MRMWIINGTVNNPVSDTPVRTDILIENGKIAAFGKYDNGDFYDASGCNIYPGLVEAHCHLGLFGYTNKADGMDINEVNEIVTPELDAIDGINPFDETFAIARSGGVTSVGTGPGSTNVLGGRFVAIKTLGRRVDDMIIKRDVAMKCAFGENPKNFHAKGISSRMTTAAKLREYLNKAKEYMLKKESANGDANKMPAYNVKMEAIIPVLKKQMPLKAHAHQANDVFTAIRIAKEFDLLLTIEHCTDGHLIADILAEENYMLAIGPTFGHASKPELYNKSFVTPGILDKAGCHVSIITDSAVIPQDQLLTVAVLAVQSGMDKLSAFKAITINPARHLGIDDRVGSIEIGKDADLIIKAADLFDLTVPLKAVFINGNIAFEKK